MTQSQLTADALPLRGDKLPDAVPSPQASGSDLYFGNFAVREGKVFDRGVYRSASECLSLLGVFIKASKAGDWWAPDAAGLADDLEAAMKAAGILCDSHQPPNNAGDGGKPPSLERTRPSTRTSPTKASTRSAASATASGPKARSFPPASGGNRVQSTLKPANSSAPKSAAPRSMGSASTLGAPGPTSPAAPSLRRNIHG